LATISSRFLLGCRSAQAPTTTDSRLGAHTAATSSPTMAGVACVTTANFFSYVLNAVLVLFAVRTLGLTPALIGLALGVGAVGGLAGTMVAGPLGRRIGAGRSIAIGAVAFAAPFALLPLAHTTVVGGMTVLAAAEFVSAAGVMVFDIHLNAVQTVVTPDRMRSRSSGVFGTVNYGARPLGAALGGATAGLIGVAPVIIAAAVGGSLAVLWLLRSPVIRVVRADDLPATP
jgi:MFS family permease